jgi:hypothetical protein
MGVWVGRLRCKLGMELDGLEYDLDLAVPVRSSSACSETFADCVASPSIGDHASYWVVPIHSEGLEVCDDSQLFDSGGLSAARSESEACLCLARWTTTGADHDHDAVTTDDEVTCWSGSERNVMLQMSLCVDQKLEGEELSVDFVELDWRTVQHLPAQSCFSAYFVQHWTQPTESRWQVAHLVSLLVLSCCAEYWDRLPRVPCCS